MYILPGSIIYTDDLRAYRPICRLDYVLHVVVHEIRFVDPSTGVHTQNIEGYWSRLKEILRSYKGLRKDMLRSHVDEFLCRSYYEFKLNEPVDNLQKSQNMKIFYPGVMF
uniref:SJCHGC02961 protein n=1 Tax=Schistosoma japonicum TaxID=6182 RepID=Q5DCH2_SCHJA|nr:SJCHGC02961 protein [Schistosoma japonicum]